MLFGKTQIPDDLYVVLVADDNPRNGGGEPICWEHPLQYATFEAAKMVQKRLGNSYGTTRIAKLVLIDENF